MTYQIQECSPKAIHIYAVDAKDNCRWVKEEHLLDNGGEYHPIPWMNAEQNKVGRMEKKVEEPDVQPSYYAMPDMQRHVTYSGMTDRYRKGEKRKQPVCESLECGHGGYISDVDQETVHKSIYALQPCSPKAAERIEQYESDLVVNAYLRSNEVYPFEIMSIGQCFIIPMTSSVANRIRVITSKKNAKTQKQFIVVKHTEFGCYEVARVK